MLSRRIFLAFVVFCFLAPLQAKEYLDPDGAFAVRLPDNWLTQRTQLDAGLWLTQLAPPGDNMESLNVLAVPTPNELQGPALDITGRTLIAAMVELFKAQGQVQVGEATRIRFDNRDALRADLTVENQGATEKGYILVVPGKRHVFLLIVGAPQGDQAALMRAEASLSSLAIESAQPKAGPALPPSPTPAGNAASKTGIPNLPTTGDARMDAFLLALVEEEKELLAMQQAFLPRMADETPAEAPKNADPAQEAKARAAFAQADAARAATMEGSKERTFAARSAMDAATAIAWHAFDARDFDEAAIWFERFAALRRESYQAARLYQDGLLAKRFTELDQWRAIQAENQTPENKQLFQIVLALLAGVQAERLQVLQTFARDSGDGAALLKYGELELQLRRGELQQVEKEGATIESLETKKAQIAKAHESIAEAQMLLAKYDDAENSLRESLKIRRALPGDFAGRDIHVPLSALGELRDNLGDLPGARDYFQQALVAFEADAPARAKAHAGEESPEARTLLHVQATAGQGSILVSMATALQNMDQHGEALKQLDRALKLADALAPEGQSGQVRNALRLQTLIMTAAIHAESGDTDLALRELKDIAPLWRAFSGDAGVVASLMSALAVYVVLYEKGELSNAQIGEARSYAEQVRRVYASTQNLSGLTLMTNIIAIIDNELNDLPNADKNAGEALTLARKIDNASEISDASVILARVRIKQNRPDDALASLEEADKFAARVGSPMDRAAIHDVRGQALEKKGDLSGALASYKQAIALMESVRAGAASESDFSNLKSRYEIYERTVRLLITMKRADEAFDYLGRAKSKQLQDNLRLANVRSPNPELQSLLDRFSGLETKLQSVTTQLQTEQSRPAAERDPAKIETLKVLVATTQGEYRRVFEEIKTKHPNWEANLTVKPRELKATQPGIPEGVVLVQYAPLGEQIYIFVVTRDNLKIYTPPAKAEDVWQRIKTLRNLIVQEGKRGIALPAKLPAADKPVGTMGNLLALYDMLIKPIEADLKDAKTIAFIPNQSLYYLPFHALARREGEKVRYLIEDKEVVYLTGADVMRVIQTPNTNKKKEGLIAFGNPTGAELPASLEEVQTIAAIYPNSQTLTGAAVTKSAITAPAILDKRVVHFATHGFLNASVPSQSYIQLAKGGTPQSEQLTVDEVWDLPLKNVDLVTLSACETALSQRSPNGGDITTLAEAFSTAGATTITCSLWSVADDSTKDLMVEFYKQLSAGATKAAALRAAQLKVMNNPPTAHPFHWAPFILMGDWR